MQDIKLEDIDLSFDGKKDSPSQTGFITNNSSPSFWDGVAETNTEFEDIKPGTYQVTIHSTGLKEYSKGGRGFELVAKLESGQQDWTYFTFEHPNQNVVGMGKRDLKALFNNFNVPLVEDLNTMLQNLQRLEGKEATLTIDWVMKNNFKVKDALGNEAISSEYDKDNADHHYINKKFKPV